MKLIGNSLILGSIELIAEAYTVAEKSGVGQEVVYEYIKGNSRTDPEAQFTDVSLTRRTFPRSDVSEQRQRAFFSLELPLILFCSWLNYGDKMLHNKFDGSVGFNIDGGVKDATHMRRLSLEHNSPWPAIENASNHMLTARALHTAQERTGTTTFPVLDWSSLIAGTRVAAGLDPFGGAEASYLPSLARIFMLKRISSALTRSLRPNKPHQI